jgi:hypothetical protein
MLIVDRITDDPKQKMTVTLPDGSEATLRLEYKPNQLGWFIVELTRGAFSIKGARIVASPNLLDQQRNLINFGLCCLTTDGHDPMLLEDFSSGRATLYILTQAEVQQYARFLSGQDST